MNTSREIAVVMMCKEPLCHCCAYRHVLKEKIASGKRPTQGPVRLRLFDLRKDISDSNQLIVEDLFGDIQQAKDRDVSDRVVDVQPFFPTDYDIATPQDPELLRQCALFYLQKITKSVHPQFPIAKGIEHRNAKGVSQRLEKFGLESPEFGHA
jgi:hypothetical protein